MSASRRLKPEPLRRRADFSRIYERGRRYRGKYLTAVILTRSESAPPGTRAAQPDPAVLRAAFVVSNKVARQAVQRNRVRRRLREALRSLMREHGPITGRDLILIAAPSAVDATYWQLYEELRTLLNKAHVWTSSRRDEQPLDPSPRGAVPRVENGCPPDDRGEEPLRAEDSVG